MESRNGVLVPYVYDKGSQVRRMLDAKAVMRRHFFIDRNLKQKSI